MKVIKLISYLVGIFVILMIIGIAFHLITFAFSSFLPLIIACLVGFIFGRFTKTPKRKQGGER